MVRLVHELTRLHAAELCERPVRCLISPNALRRGQQRIAAIAVLVITIVLIAVNDDLVAHLPPLNLGADCPDHARRIGACDVEWMLVTVERSEEHTSELQSRPHLV